MTDTERIRELEEKASALVAKLRLIHGDGRYLAVWQIAQNHIGPYSGPQYEAELAALDAALAGKGGA